MECGKNKRFSKKGGKCLRCGSALSFACAHTPRGAEAVRSASLAHGLFGETFGEDFRGEGDEFGRTTGLGTLTTGPWYAIPVAPGIHHCMGGVFVDADAQALTIKREKVAGLFAAGEVTGGIHGSNRLGGNAVCDIVVNGIKAGRKAVESLM